MPKVSVIIPTYNSARYIRESIESVLAQTYNDFEIIVVDDGSTDETVQVLEAYRPCIIYVYQNNQERSAARNHGVKVSHGEYLVFLDSDDFLLPETLAREVNELDSNPELGLVASGYNAIDKYGNLLQEIKPWRWQPIIDLESILFQGLAPPNAVMLRRDWFDQVGGFSTAYSGPEDMDFWYRLAVAKCPMVWVRQINAVYRIHENNSSWGIKKHYDQFFMVLDNFFEHYPISETIILKKAEIYAHVRLAEAGRLYSNGQFLDGKESLGKAIKAYPSLLNAHGRIIIEAFMAWENGFWLKEKVGFLEQVIQNLPKSLDNPPWSKNEIEIYRTKYYFYQAIDLKNIDQIRRNWLRMVKLDYKWLFNRGSWSILLCTYPSYRNFRKFLANLHPQK